MARAKMKTLITRQSSDRRRKNLEWVNFQVQRGNSFLWFDGRWDDGTGDSTVSNDWGGAYLDLNDGTLGLLLVSGHPDY